MWCFHMTNKLDAVVTKGFQSIRLRCGTSDGVEVGFDPMNPIAAAVGNNVPVLSPVQMHRFLQQPLHRIGCLCVVQVSLGAVSEPVSTDTPECVQTLLQEFGDCFPAKLRHGLHPTDVWATALNWNLARSLCIVQCIGCVPLKEASEVHNTVTERVAEKRIETAIYFPVWFTNSVCGQEGWLFVQGY